MCDTNYSLTHNLDLLTDNYQLYPILQSCSRCVYSVRVRSTHTGNWGYLIYAKSVGWLYDTEPHRKQFFHYNQAKEGVIALLHYKAISKYHLRIRVTV